MGYILLVKAAMIAFIYIAAHSIKQYDIHTGLSLRPTSEVPFPAIFIHQKGSEFDPLRQLKQSGNLVKQEDLPETGLLGIFNVTQCQSCPSSFFPNVKKALFRHCLDSHGI